MPTDQKPTDRLAFIREKLDGYRHPEVERWLVSDWLDEAAKLPQPSQPSLEDVLQAVSAAFSKRFGYDIQREDLFWRGVKRELTALFAPPPAAVDVSEDVEELKIIATENAAECARLGMALKAAVEAGDVLRERVSELKRKLASEMEATHGLAREIHERWQPDLAAAQARWDELLRECQVGAMFYAPEGGTHSADYVNGVRDGHAFVRDRMKELAAPSSAEEAKPGKPELPIEHRLALLESLVESLWKKAGGTVVHVEGGREGQ